LLLHLAITALTYNVAKISSESFGGSALVGLRISLTVFIFFLIGTYKNGFSIIPKKLMPRMIFCGILVALNQAFFLKGMSLGAPPAHASILYATTPVFVLIISLILKEEKIVFSRIFGLVLAFLGTYWILGNSGLSAFGNGEKTILMGVVCWAIYTSLIPPISKSIGAKEAVSRSFLIGLPIAIAIFLMGEKPDFSTITPFAWYGLFHIAFLTSIVAYSIWATALQFLKPSQVAVFINLQPPTTALVAMAVYKQIPQEGFWLALPIVLFGVWTVQRK